MIHPLVRMNGKVKSHLLQHVEASLLGFIATHALVSLKVNPLTVNPFGKTWIGGVPMRYQTMTVLGLAKLQNDGFEPCQTPK